MNDIKQLWGAQAIRHHVKYLELPSFVGRSNVHTFRDIKNKIWIKLQGWKKKLLSQAGCEVLIKAIVQTIPNYAMCCFKLPKGFYREIEGLIARF